MADLAIVLDATVGYDPADPQTAASVGNIPKTYTDYLQLKEPMVCMTLRWREMDSNHWSRSDKGLAFLRPP